MTGRHRIRVTLVTVVIGLLGLLGAGTASAHNALIDSDPVDGTALTASPTEITLTFNDVVQNLQPLITVVGPTGGRWEGSPVSVLNNTASVPVNPLGPAGTYTVAYRVISSDGHAVEGTTTFELRSAGTGTPNAESGTDGSTAASKSVPAWVWVLGAGLVIILVVVVGVVTTRRRTADQPD
ncbi:MAG: copper resistance CopC family protein [Nakamurella sp.]